MIDYFSGLLALFAFAAVILIGLIRGDAPGEILREALVGMLAFLVIGRALSYIGKRLITEELEDEEASVAAEVAAVENEKTGQDSHKAPV